MTEDQKRRLNSGMTQSSSDSRRYNGQDDYSHKIVGDNRTIIKGKTYYGFTAANNARNNNE